MIDLRQFRYFIAVAEELHFGRAAARLHIVQPALSMQIKALEKHLGAELLTRTRQGVALTPVGTSFLREARRAVAQAERAEAVGRKAAGGEIGLLRVGLVGSAPFSGLLSRVIASFLNSFPDVEMQLVELTSDEQVERLRDDVLDVGFLRLPLISGANFEVVRLGQERMMVALQSSHSLAGQKVIAPSALRSEKFIMAGGRANAGLSAVVRRICEKSGFIPDVTQTVSQITTAITLVEAGLGVAFVPESFAAMQIGTIVYRHLRGVEDVSEIGLVAMARGRSPIASNFMKCAAATAASGPRQR